jgi:hypothetical protein
MNKRKLNNKYRKPTVIYNIVAFCIKVFYRKSECIGLENLPKEPCIIASNHSKLHGPVNAELYFPTKKMIWCDEPMIEKTKFYDYAYKTFWNDKPTIFHKAFILFDFV